MAVSNFYQDYTYRFKFFDMFDYVRDGSLIPVKYIKVCPEGKPDFAIELTGYYFLKKIDDWNVEICYNYDYGVGYPKVCLISTDTGNSRGYVEFVYGYIEGCEYEAPYPNDSSSNNFYGISYLVQPAQSSQVRVFNEHDNYWWHLPCCSEYSGISTTIVDSGRNAEGVVIGDVIKSDVAKVEMKWNFLTLEQYSFIAQLFEETYNGKYFVNVSFFDVVKGDFDGRIDIPPSSNNNPCRIMYPSDRKVSFAHIKLAPNGTPIGYENVSLNLIDTGKRTGD